MFSQIWRRLTGVGETSAPEGGPAASETPAPAAQGNEAGATAPAGPAAPATASEPTLHRSLNWRARVLLEGASRDSLHSDGPELVESLRNANEMVIRQPPAAAQRAMLLARDPETPLPLVAALFENDPMLAQALLRQANSVFYRRDGAPCTSIPSGVQRIGSKAVQGVLMSSMVQQLLCRPGGAYDPLVQKVWTHMQRTAPIARAIAPAFGVDGEVLYSLALLHDVGKLVVFDHISRIRHDRRRDLKMPDLFLEQLLWHLHEPIGGLAALRWDMGPEAAHAIAEHHRRPVPESTDRVTECLHVAEKIELAHTNFTKLDWEQIWSDAGITADVAAVQDRLNHVEE